MVLGGAVLAVPVALGFHGETELSSLWLWAAAFSCGIGAAYVLKSLCCAVRKGLSLKKNSLDQVEVADRAAAKTYLDGLSCQEIASIVGRPPKSVDNAVQRVRRKVAQQLRISEGGRETEKL